ncbi:MAG: Flp family type IVb pilin [Pseudomonadota bacterium]
MSKLREFKNCIKGTAPIEYGIIGLVVSVAIIGGIQNYASEQDAIYEKVRSAVTTAFDDGAE